MRFESWASITNPTGVEYVAAKVTLVAGATNRLVTKPSVAADGDVYPSTVKATNNFEDFGF